MRNFRVVMAVACLGFVFSLGIVSGWSQIVSCTLTGTVFDPSGSVLPNATVTATNGDTNLTRVVTTNEAGRFTFAALPPGTYTLTTAADGFVKQQVRGIILQVEQTVNWDFHLTLGTLAQEVSVQAESLQIQSETSSVGQIVNEQQMNALPLNGRSFLSLATLGSGSVPAYQDRSSPIGGNTGRANLAVHISGGRADANSYLIDGVESRAFFLGQPGIELSLAAIQEFRVQKNNFDARYGKDSGIVNLITQSGSTTLHGSIYEYLRNDALDAANYFDNFFGRPKFAYKQNQFGGALGGTIVKGKVFFFSNYEGLRVRRGNTGSAFIPTPAQMNGDLSSISTPIIDPSTGTPFPGNIIPAGELSPAIQKFKQYIPAPNVNLVGINYVFSPVTVRTDDQATGRIDWNLRKDDTLFGRYIYFKSDLTQPGMTPLVGMVLPMHGQNAAIEETHIFSPSMINVFKIGYNRSLFLNSPIVGSTSYNDQLGITNVDNGPRAFALPAFQVVGYSIPAGSRTLQGSIDNLFQFTDEVAWSHGKHSMSFGADIRRTQIQFLFGLSVNGTVAFDGRYSGNALADFLLGVPASASVQQGLTTANLRSTSSSFFFQDDYKITSRLTFNLGVRWEYAQPLNEINGLQGFFDTAQQRMVVRAPASAFPLVVSDTLVDYDPGYRPGLYVADRNNWAPRFGFAYGLTKNSVLRGGYGIFYSERQGQEIQGELNFPPLVISQSLQGTPVGSPPNLSVDQLFPGPATAQVTGAISPFSVNPNDRTPYLQQWNLGVQHTFGKSMLAEVAYVGSRGVKQNGRFDLNQAHLDADPNNPTPVATRRPFPAWGRILAFNFNDSSNYSGLQSKLEMHYSNGLSFLAGYTWSHAFDLTSQGAGGSFHQNTYDLQAEYASSDFDVRNNFTLSFSYELPFGHGKQFLDSSGVLNAVVGGWSVNGITSMMTGNYYSVVVNGDRANVGGTYTERANAVAGCKDNGNLSHGDRTIARYFDTSCFVLPAFGTFGNTGRNIVESPGLNNWDISLIKSMRLTERLNAQIRAEFFNAWNHAQFGVPDMTVNSPTFGRITTARDPREIQLALRLGW